LLSAVLPQSLVRLTRRMLRPVLHARLPKGFGTGAAAVVLLGSLGYGAVQGGHVGEFVEALKDARDAAANAAGFRIRALAVNGQQHMSREEIWRLPASPAAARCCSSTSSGARGSRPTLGR
jgi:cell division protein FtsQ